MSSPVKTSNFFTEPVGIRTGKVAPRWVPVLVGLTTGTVLIAVESHGAFRIVVAILAIVMLVVLATAGRRHTTPRA